MARYEVIPSKVWQRDDGARASIYGSVPWLCEAEKARWQVVVQGWTIRDNHTGTVGMGRARIIDKSEADALAAKFNARCAA